VRASILGVGPRAIREQTGPILAADFFSHFCLFLYHGLCVISFLISVFVSFGLGGKML